MDQKILGKKLQRAREKQGLTQEAVEQALGLPQKAVTRIETGQRQISTLELMKIAELFHRPIADFLSDQDTIEEDLLTVLYRCAPGLEKDPKIQKEVSRYVYLCREGAFLEDSLNISSRPRMSSYLFGLPQNTFHAIEQGEQAAKDERRRLGLGNLPIHDIVELFSSQGIWCMGTELPHDMSGLFLHDPSLGIAILVNAHHVRSRQHFSYAHEYAHALFDQDNAVLISASHNASELIEKRANAFAAAFLLPSEGIAELLQSIGKGGSSRNSVAIFDVANESVMEAEDRLLASAQKISPQDVALIAHHFRVSYQATIYRLHSLRYLSPKEREKLLQEELVGKEYLRMLDFLQDLDEKEKSSFQQRELKAYISRLVIEAYRCEKISRGRLMELSKLLCLPGEKLLEMAKTNNS